MKIVETKGLTKKFGKIKALDHLSLQIEEGENFGLLGPNGSGKTTLIRILAGLLKASSGEARVFGKKVPNLVILKDIGYMTQLEALYQDLTVRENLNFFATLYGLYDRKKRELRVEEVLKVIDLADRKNSLVETLSGGMKQRVSLACALVHGPRLLFLDEPTVGIDPELRLSFWNYFSILNRQGVTLIISSHNLEEAQKCHRLGFLKEGKLIATGTSQELKSAAKASTLEEAYLNFAREDELA